MRQVVRNLDQRVKAIEQKINGIETMLANSNSEIEETAKVEKNTWL